jgi:hypothetical protein
MRADYDSEANAISITLVQDAPAGKADSRHPRAVVALRNEEPVALQLLYPDMGIAEPLRAVAAHYELDAESLIAAAHAALAAPDRTVTLEVALRSSAA